MENISSIFSYCPSVYCKHRLLSHSSNVETGLFIRVWINLHDNEQESLSAVCIYARHLSRSN